MGEGLELKSTFVFGGAIMIVLEITFKLECKILKNDDGCLKWFFFFPITFLFKCFR